MAEQTPDNIITTQRNGQTIVAELFSITAAQKHSATSCSNWCLPTVRVYPRLTVKSRKNRNLAITAAPTNHSLSGRFLFEILIFPKSRAGKNTRKMPLLRNRGAERRVYENRAYEAGKDHRYLV